MSTSTTLTLIGFWYSDTTPHWPHPDDFVDPGWDGDDRDAVLDHLAGGFINRAYMGYSTCRICGQRNGTLERTDGVFAWPEGLHHYVEQHQVRLPDRFITHVNAMTESRENAVRQESWWRTYGKTAGDEQN